MDLRGLGIAVGGEGTGRDVGCPPLHATATSGGDADRHRPSSRGPICCGVLWKGALVFAPRSQR